MIKSHVKQFELTHLRSQLNKRLTYLGNKQLRKSIEKTNEFSTLKIDKNIQNYH